ncbi:MAG: hypothetical protein GDA47_02910, partial [Rhodospirillales bacterium]|nr:hypothetical protein [Rhodospirillales bacterium]
MTKSDLPFGSEFSPSQIELPGMLQLLEDRAGDPAAIEAAIRQTYFASHSGS